MQELVASRGDEQLTARPSEEGVNFFFRPATTGPCASPVQNSRCSAAQGSSICMQMLCTTDFAGTVSNALAWAASVTAVHSYWPLATMGNMHYIDVHYCRFLCG